MQTLRRDFDVRVMASEANYRKALHDGEVQMAYRELHASYPSQLEFLQAFIDIFGATNISPEIQTLRDMLQAASSRDGYRQADRVVRGDGPIHRRASHDASALLDLGR